MIVPIHAGAARRMTKEDIARAAESIGVDTATIRAIIAVESSGHGFDERGRPRILFEPHVFYRNLSGDDRQHALMLGIAYPKWGTRPYPSSSDANYARLEDARKINNEMAFRSVSIGLGQILGENFRATGNPSAAAMFVIACQSEGAQLQQMINFIKYNGLDQYLRNKNWAGFASHYNGPGYAKNHYDVKLANEYRRAKLGGL